MTDKKIIEFLLGSGKFDEVWFGDDNPKYKGLFWWRDHLRKYIDLSATELQEKQKEIDELKGKNSIPFNEEKQELMVDDLICKYNHFKALSEAAEKVITHLKTMDSLVRQGYRKEWALTNDRLIGTYEQLKNKKV